MKIYYITISILLITSLLFAQEEQNNLPRLNNHYFIPNSTTPNPFIKSSFNLSLGVAASNDFEDVILEIDDQRVLGLQGSIIFADLKFHYQQKVKDWIAFFLSAGITARLGTDMQSMLSQGVNTVSSFKIGWLVNVLENEKNNLSASIQINNYTANFINISGFIGDIIDQNPNPSISKNVPILNGSLGLRYAHGFSEKFGFIGFGEFGYGESYQRGISDFIYHFGGSFDLNLATTTKVPLGFALFYNLTSRPELVQVNNKFATNGGIKISYAGSEHFNLGLEIANLRVPIPNVDEKVSSGSFIISSIYYFN